MVNQNIIQILSDGICLEDKNILLPWGASRQKLVRLCLPSRIVKTLAWEELYWDDPRLLENLKALTLEADIPPQGHFNLAWIWLEKGLNPEKVIETFEKAFVHLSALFGPATSPLPVDYENLDKLIVWETLSSAIGLHLRPGSEFDDFSYCCKLSVGPKTRVELKE